MNEPAYDPIAEWYDTMIREGSLLHELAFPDLLELIDQSQGQVICDLGCGQGILSRHLARQGAIMTGIDLSDNQLQIARRYEADEPLGITYFQGDAQDTQLLAGQTFDGVICMMALMDIPDLSATLQNVHRLLRPGRWFLLVITHPPLISRYTSRSL